MFTDKFNSLSSIVGLSKDEVATAKFFWYAGVKYALKMNTNVPALLKPKATHAEEQAAKFWLNRKVTDYYDKEETQLTGYEAKFMTLVLSKFLSVIDKDKSELKQIKKELWEMCNPEDETSKPYFNDLNKVKHTLAKIKDQQKTIANVQRKLKKMSKQ